MPRNSDGKRRENVRNTKREKYSPQLLYLFKEQLRSHFKVTKKKNKETKGKTKKKNRKGEKKEKKVWEISG